MFKFRHFLMRSLFAVLGHEYFKFFIRNKFMATICAEVIIRKLSKLATASSADSLNVLVFSAFRYKQDLRCLAETGKYSFWSIDAGLMTSINAIFRKRSLKESDNYFTEDDPEVLRLRMAQQQFLAHVLRWIQKRLGMDVIITPAIHYRSEYDWCRAGVLAKVPTVAIHKEFTLIGQEHIRRRVKNYLDNCTVFTGSRVLTTNETGKNLFSEAGIHDPSRIEMVGLPRADQVLGPDSPFRIPGPRKLATLFSFGHYSGEMENIPENRRSHYFSWGNRDGFVKLVAGTHTAFAKAAIDRPDFQFVIKPKYVTKEWSKVIEELVLEGTGKHLNEIPNLQIVDEEAPSLMRDSSVVVAFNSTVVIESRILNRPTLIPMFGEAVGDLNRFVYFNEFLSLFETPKSAVELHKRIVDLVDGKTTTQGNEPEELDRFVRKHLGYADGKASERVYEQLKIAIGDAQAMYEKVTSANIGPGQKKRKLN